MTELEELRDHFVSVLPNVVGPRRELMADQIRVISSAIEEIDKKTSALKALLFVVKLVGGKAKSGNTIRNIATEALSDD